MSDTDQGHGSATFKDLSQGKSLPPEPKPFAEQGQMPGFGTAEQAKPFEPTAKIEPVKEPEPVDAKTKLRDFEDAKLGDDAVRIEGKIEKGHGSKFSNLSHAEKAEHAALEKVVEAERHLSEATAKLGVAQAHHAEAKAAVDRHHGHK